MELCYFTEREWENGKFLYDFTEDELINLIQSKTPDTVVVMPDSVLYIIGVSSFDLITIIWKKSKLDLR